MEKLRHRFYTGANESAVSQIIIAFKIKIHAANGLQYFLEGNNRYNDLCLQIIVSKIGSEFINLYCFGNHCHYYHRDIAEVLIWSIVYSSYWIGELNSHPIVIYGLSSRPVSYNSYYLCIVVGFMSLNLNWDEIIKKDARGIEDYDLGEIHAVESDTVVTKKGIVDKDKFYLPKNLVESYDGDKLHFRVTKEEAQTYRRD